MILNDSHRFAFVHVPKCAGTSVRQQLANFDSTGGAFAGGLMTLDGVGPVDTAHIPLNTLRDHFPEAFEKVATYASFAILRDPLDRFPASLFQRLKMYGETDIAALSPEAVRAVAAEVIDVLRAHGPRALLPHDFIHFQPQATYVELEDRRIVSNLFDMGNLGAFFAAANRQLGDTLKDSESLQAKKTNQSRVFRSSLASAMVSRIPTGLRYPLLALVPAGLKNALRRAAFEPGNKRLADIMQDAEIVRFVESFYARDIALYQEIRANQGAT